MFTGKNKYYVRSHRSVLPTGRLVPRTVHKINDPIDVGTVWSLPHLWNLSAESSGIRTITLFSTPL